MNVWVFLRVFVFKCILISVKLIEVSLQLHLSSLLLFSGSNSSIKMVSLNTEETRKEVSHDTYTLSIFISTVVKRI